mmetsp:Transcript_12139/g.34791  ORF Transcript_12139/g.34791 Transcript_12139/m.34791 type:complete len:341 (+) Transcript_12139:79-1101(+)
MSGMLRSALFAAVPLMLKPGVAAHPWEKLQLKTPAELRSMSDGPLTQAFEELEAESASHKGAWDMHPTMDKERNVPGCTINSFVAFFYLNQASEFIAKTSSHCEGNMTFGSSGSKQCAANILGIIQTFWNAGAYLAGLASQCSQAVNGGAECTAVIMGIIGTLTDFFEGVTDSCESCGLIASHGQPELENNTLSTYEGLGGGTALCYIDIGSAVTFFTQEFWLLDGAVNSCTVQETDSQRHQSAAGATSVIAAFSEVMSFISGAASQCAATVNLPALRTKDISRQLSGLSGLASHLVDVQSTCGFHAPLETGNFADGVVEATRRLSAQARAQGTEEAKFV